MTLWFVLALMTAAAIFAVLWPLARQATSRSSGSDVVVYRDQLDEIRRDRAAGLIGESEAAAAEVEVARRLIAADDAATAAAPATPSATTSRRKVAAAIALVALPAGALALYLAVGSPTLPGQPLTSRASPDRQSIATMVAQVEAHLLKNPNEGRGWEVIAPIYLRMGRFDDAVKARRQALALNGESAERHVGLGEALTAAAGGVVTAEALAELKAAVALDPDHFKARYFLGVAAEQDGRNNDAAGIWRALLAGAPPNAQWAPFVRSELARIVGGPTGDLAAVAADMSPEQRTAMIRAMVDGLAERLGKDGSDIEGWLRLVRSYMVLGERDKALAAAGDARRALAAEPDKLRRIDEMVKGLGLDG